MKPSVTLQYIQEVTQAQAVLYQALLRILACDSLDEAKKTADAAIVSVTLEKPRDGRKTPSPSSPVSGPNSGPSV